jgi:hypothetical protein
MSEKLQSRLAVWLPVIMCFVGPLVVVGMFYGTVRAERQEQQKVNADLHNEIMPMPQRMEVFVTRREFNTLEKAVSETQKLAIDSNAKITSLWEAAERRRNLE